jgi:hypothetical protein
MLYFLAWLTSFHMAYLKKLLAFSPMIALHRPISLDFRLPFSTSLYFTLRYLVSHSWISYVLPLSYHDSPYPIMFCLRLTLFYLVTFEE